MKTFRIKFFNRVVVLSIEIRPNFERLRRKFAKKNKLLCNHLDTPCGGRYFGKYCGDGEEWRDCQN